jgi:nitroreductase
LNILDAIQGRHSTRAFLKQPVPQQTIESILAIARYAPSGVNTQPWQVVVLQGALKEKIGNAIIKARDSGIKENPDYAYYPSEWREPYKSRRKACGLALYSALHIDKEDTEKRKIAWYRNYHFFDAPIGLLFFVDRDLEKGSWLDMGMFIQNVMLAARGHGLDTCPQAALAEYPDIVRGFLANNTTISNKHDLICGMALGIADNSHPINQYRTTREPVSSFTQYPE